MYGEDTHESVFKLTEQNGMATVPHVDGGNGIGRMRKGGW